MKSKHDKQWVNKAIKQTLYLVLFAWELISRTFWKICRRKRSMYTILCICLSDTCVNDSDIPSPSVKKNGSELSSGLCPVSLWFLSYFEIPDRKSLLPLPPAWRWCVQWSRSARTAAVQTRTERIAAACAPPQRGEADFSSGFTATDEPRTAPDK